MSGPVVSKSLSSLIGVSTLMLCLLLVAARNGAMNTEHLRAYRQAIAGLEAGMEERSIWQSFRRAPAMSPNYTIGVTSVADHQPYFGGRAYRVYDLGYYDMDRRLIRMAHIICEDGKIRRVEHVTDPRTPD